MIANKTIIVTGSNQGIGLEFVKQLGSRTGNKIIAAVRTISPELKDLELKGKVAITKLDVAKPESIAAWAEGLAVAQTGHVDYVINNAGVYGRRVGLDTATAEDMLYAFQTNTIGPMLVVQQLFKQNLIGSPETVIASVTSKMGSIEDNTSGGSYAYRASKCALNIINKSWSIDLAPLGVKSVLLHPGYVRTNMTGGNGLIDVDTSVSGMLAVLESDRELNGRWYDFAGKEIPW